PYFDGENYGYWKTRMTVFIQALNYDLYYESIYYMFDRFTNIINSLNSLGKSFSNNELVRKILRSLPKSWQDKVTVIEEAKDLTKLKLEDLLGSLLTHELAM
ncbi:DUF4219 domain-containing protein/UBN2 domain-containing protein, partial [Cephalotus follicularis]